MRSETGCGSYRCFDTCAFHVHGKDVAYSVGTSLRRSKPSVGGILHGERERKFTVFASGMWWKSVIALDRQAQKEPWMDRECTLWAIWRLYGEVLVSHNDAEDDKEK